MPVHFLANEWTERVTGGPKVIDTDHAYIHEGAAYELSFSRTSAASTATYVFKTPAAGYVHFRPSQVFIEKGSLAYSFIENAGSTAPGSTWPSTGVAYNRSRISTSTAASIFYTETTAMDGTNTVIDTWTLWGSAAAGAFKQGAAHSEPLEWVLKQNTNYQLTFDTTEAYNANLFWYEEEKG